MTGAWLQSSAHGDCPCCEKTKQREALRTLLDIGVSLRQLQRLTGLGRGYIQRV